LSRTRLLIPALVLLSACAGDTSPEQRIRERLSEAVLAAEDRDLGALRTWISDDYADTAGRDKREIESLLALYLRQNAGLHLFAVIRDVAVTSNERAEATMLVAMAASPIRDESELGGLTAELYQIDIGLVLEARQWKVARAFWEPVTLD